MSELEQPVKIEKQLPRKNCIRFWESMLFYDKAFLPVATVVIIEATIKWLQEADESSSHPIQIKEEKDGS